MGNLTQKDEQGNWSLKGVKWSDLYAGQIITEEIYEKLYGALWKLMEYESTELEPNQVQELQEREKEKKDIYKNMSSGLISRKELMQEIDSLYMSITGLRAVKGVLLKFMEEYKKIVLKCIEETPTAYDVDAVCEKIQRQSDNANDNITKDKWNELYWSGRQNGLDEALEIMRNGGKKK